jgi:hypothetical protein
MRKKEKGKKRKRKPAVPADAVLQSHAGPYWFVQSTYQVHTCFALFPPGSSMNLALP